MSVLLMHYGSMLEFLQHSKSAMRQKDYEQVKRQQLEALKELIRSSPMNMPERNAALRRIRGPDSPNNAVLSEEERGELVLALASTAGSSMPAAAVGERKLTQTHEHFENYLLERKWRVIADPASTMHQCLEEVAGTCKDGRPTTEPR